MSKTFGLAPLLDWFSDQVPQRLGRSIRWRILKWFPTFMSGGVQIRAAGATWQLYPSNNVTERLLYLHREVPEVQSLAALLTHARGKRVLFHDIGANCGAYSVPLAKSVAPGSRIIAFEPNPVMVERLRKNVDLNAVSGIVQIEPTALGSQTGEALLGMRSERNLGEASLLGATEGVTVPVEPLSRYSLPGRPFDLRVLKIDVEGYEPEVLRPFFENTAPDVWPGVLLIETEHRGAWSSDLLDFLKTLEYRAAFVGEGNTLLLYEPSV